jgi:hypothetical protein
MAWTEEMLMPKGSQGRMLELLDLGGRRWPQAFERINLP